MNILARLLEHPGIWRGRSLTTHIDTRSSGFPELDARLVGGGWPKVGLVEILATHLGSGELRLLLPLLAAGDASAPGPLVHVDCTPPDTLCTGPGRAWREPVANPGGAGAEG